MAVEDHPLYDEWLKASEVRNEADSRFMKARMAKAGDLELYREDLRRAQKVYDEVCDRLG